MWLLLIVKLQIRAENANSQDQHHTVMCHLENHGNHENHGIREIQNPGFSLKTSSFLTVPFFLKVLGSAGLLGEKCTGQWRDATSITLW